MDDWQQARHFTLQNLEAFTITELGIFMCWHILPLLLQALLMAEVIVNSGDTKACVLVLICSCQRNLLED